MEGIIIINKPKGFTSQDVVSKVKGILKVKKAGHTGTLDPMATGVLPVLLGNYTKLSKYLIEHNKTYIATIKLGEKRETGDLEGKVVEKKDVDLNLLSGNNVKNILDSFLGKQKQIPPMYSAIKVNGKKLYEYAREGKKVNVEPRNIEIYNINLLEINIKNYEIKFEVNCSKGTYIRVLCEDIAQKLNTVGYMLDLTRILVDNFSIKDAINFETLKKNKNNEEYINSKIITMESLFKNFPQIVLSKRKEWLFLNGVKLSFEKDNGIYNIYTYNNKYLGTGIVENNLLKRDVIL